MLKSESSRATFLLEARKLSIFKKNLLFKGVFLFAPECRLSLVAATVATALSVSRLKVSRSFGLFTQWRHLRKLTLFFFLFSLLLLLLKEKECTSSFQRKELGTKDVFNQVHL